MATATYQTPLSQIARHVVPPVALDATVETPVYVNDALGGVVTVTSVKYFGAAAFTGAADNNRTFSLYNRLGTGAGTVLVAVLNMGDTINLVAFVGKAIVLSVTAADLDLAVGDVLTWKSETIGTGIADPGGTVEIILSRA